MLFSADWHNICTYIKHKKYIKNDKKIQNGKMLKKGLSIIFKIGCLLTHLLDLQ